MANRTRATLTSKWWADHFKSIRHCFACGQKLIRRYVKEEESRRHVCSGCEKITYLNPKVIAGLIPVMPDNRVILLRRSIEPARGKWTYPAGYLELGESVQEGALRETFEEIGVRATIDESLGVYSYANAGVLTVVYLGRVLKNETPRLTNESIAVDIFRATNIPWKDLAFRSTVDALRDWKKICQKRKT